MKLWIVVQDGYQYNDNYYEYGADVYNGNDLEERKQIFKICSSFFKSELDAKVKAQECNNRFVNSESFVPFDRNNDSLQPFRVVEIEGELNG